MKKVFIGLSASNKLYARMIRWLTKSEVNHSFIIIQDPGISPDWLVVEIDHRGVVLVGARPALAENTITEFYQNNNSADLLFAVKDKFDYLGSSYSWLGILGFLLKLVVLRIFRRNIDNPVHRSGELFCSEYVATILNDAGISFDGDFLEPNNTSPGLLREKIRKSLDGDWTEHFLDIDKL